MPVYKYRCLDCDHEFERHLPIKNSDDISCPECDGETRKVIDSAPEIRFLGGGFYTTDSKKE